MEIASKNPRAAKISPYSCDRQIYEILPGIWEAQTKGLTMSTTIGEKKHINLPTIITDSCSLTLDYLFVTLISWGNKPYEIILLPTAFPPPKVIDYFQSTFQEVAEIQDTCAL